MVLGKGWIILTGNGAEIRPLEMSKKGPNIIKLDWSDYCVLYSMKKQRILIQKNLSVKYLKSTYLQETFFLLIV